LHIEEDLVKKSTGFEARLKEYSNVWKNISPASTIFGEFTIEGALNRATIIGKEKDSIQTLITGSQYLVGGVLRLLETDAPEIVDEIDSVDHYKYTT
jgi:hypothetical protein